MTNENKMRDEKTEYNINRQAVMVSALYLKKR